MSHCVDRKVNITPLPRKHRKECLIECYEHLEPGQTLQVIDDFNPDWIKGFLREECNVKLKEDMFRIKTNAGRFEALIQKPESNQSGQSNGSKRESTVEG